MNIIYNVYLVVPIGELVPTLRINNPDHINCYIPNLRERQCYLHFDF